MNFDLDDALAYLGKESIEDVDFVAVSFITINGDNIISWYYQMDKNSCLIGFPFLVKKDNTGKIYSIERYNILSDDTFFVMPISSILLLGNLSDTQFKSFEILCEKWIAALESDTRGEEETPEDIVTQPVQVKKNLH